MSRETRAARRQRSWRALSALLPVVLGVAAVVAVLAMWPDYRWVSVRVALFCAVIASFATSVLLRRYERAAERDFISEQDRRRRQVREVDRALVDLRNRLAAIEERLAGVEVRPDAGAAGDDSPLRREVSRLLARQDSLESSFAALRDDLAHELSALAGRARRVDRHDIRR